MGRFFLFFQDAEFTKRVVPFRTQVSSMYRMGWSSTKSMCDEANRVPPSIADVPIPMCALPNRLSSSSIRPEKHTDSIFESTRARARRCH